MVAQQVRPVAASAPPRARRRGDGRAAALYMAPAGILLAAVLVYPI